MNSIVLLSGWGFRADAMRLMSQYLSEQFTCHHADLGDLTQDSMEISEGFSQFMEQHDPPVYVVGWSTGAMLALDYAVQHPTRIAGLFLISGALRFCDDPEEHMGPSRANLRALRTALRRSCMPTLTSFVEQVAHPFIDDSLKQNLTQYLDERPAPLFGGLNFLEQFDLREHALPENMPPTFLLHGKADQVVPLSRCQELRSHINPSDTVRYPSGGHALPFTHAKPIAGYITHHIQRIPRP